MKNARFIQTFWDDLSLVYRREMLFGPYTDLIKGIAECENTCATHHLHVSQLTVTACGPQDELQVVRQEALQPVHDIR